VNAIKRINEEVNEFLYLWVPVTHLFVFSDLSQITHAPTDGHELLKAEQ
jgi:hypothetical protein